MEPFPAKMAHLVHHSHQSKGAIARERKRDAGAQYEMKLNEKQNDCH